MMKDTRNTTTPPFKRPAGVIFFSSLIIALLTGGLSIAGIIYRESIYQSPHLINAFAATDVVNLLLGVLPLLLGMLLVQLRRPIGLYIWSASLFLIIYHYIAYLFSLSLTIAVVFYLSILVIGVFTLLGLVIGFDASFARVTYADKLPGRPLGVGLTIIGGLILFRTIYELVGQTTSVSPVPDNESAVLVADYFVAVAWIIGGIWLLWRPTSAYAVAISLNINAVFLFSGLVIWFFANTALFGNPFVWADAIAMSVVAVIVSIPLWFLVWRRVG